MKQGSLVVFFILMDWFTAILAWVLFYYFRKVSLEKVNFEVGEAFYWGVTVIPILWLLLYYLQGIYSNIKRLFRFKLLGLTFIGSLIGSVFIFFTLLLDDTISGYQMYYKSVLMLFGIHFLVVFIPRFIFISIVVGRIHSGKNGFKTILIGGSDKAVEIYNEIQNLPKGINRFIGYVNWWCE